MSTMNMAILIISYLSSLIHSENLPHAPLSSAQNAWTSPPQEGRCIVNLSLTSLKIKGLYLKGPSVELARFQLTPWLMTCLVLFWATVEKECFREPFLSWGLPLGLLGHFKSWGEWVRGGPSKSRFWDSFRLLRSGEAGVMCLASAIFPIFSFQGM